MSPILLHPQLYRLPHDWSIVPNALAETCPDQPQQTRSQMRRRLIIADQSECRLIRPQFYMNNTVYRQASWRIDRFVELVVRTMLPHPYSTLIASLNTTSWEAALGLRQFGTLLANLSPRIGQLNIHGFNCKTNSFRSKRYVFDAEFPAVHLLTRDYFDRPPLPAASNIPADQCSQAWMAALAEIAGLPGSITPIRDKPLVPAGFHCPYDQITHVVESGGRQVRAQLFHYPTTRIEGV